MSRLRVFGTTAPSTPPTGYGYLYSFTDINLYWKNDAGTVFKINGTMAAQDSSNVTITGGVINGTPIGTTTAAAGTFTSINATSASSISSSSGVTLNLANTGTALPAGQWTYSNAATNPAFSSNNIVILRNSNATVNNFVGFEFGDSNQVAVAALVAQITDHINHYGRLVAVVRGPSGVLIPVTMDTDGRTLLGTSTNNGVDRLQVNGHIATVTAGNGFKTKEGSNAKQGTAVLVAGTATVSNTSVTADSRIFLTSNADGGTPGFVRVSARTAGTSFTITSSSGTDTSTIAYEIFEPA